MKHDCVLSFLYLFIQAASVYEAIAVCKYAHDPENTELKSMKIEGIGMLSVLLCILMKNIVF
jgi:hypothetical protein